MAQWVECSPMIQETWVQSQVMSYQRLKKWYLIPPSLTLSNIRNIPREKWSNPGKGAAPTPTPRCSSYWKGSLLVALNYGLYIRKQSINYNCKCTFTSVIIFNKVGSWWALRKLGCMFVSLSSKSPCFLLKVFLSSLSK